MIKINFYGGPGSGKSVVSALLFAELKIHHFKAELVREVAKDKVYQGIDMREAGPDLQLMIFSEQLGRELIVEKNVDYLISDSPLFLNAFYSGQDALLEIAKKRNHRKDFHIWLEREANEEFQSEGRSHTKKQSLSIDVTMKQFLLDAGLNLLTVKGTSKEKCQYILNRIIQNK